MSPRKKSDPVESGWPEGVVTKEQKIALIKERMAAYPQKSKGDPEDHSQIVPMQNQIAELTLAEDD